MTNDTFGLSGMAAYVPPYRVSLEQWCAWTGNDWEKVRAVVGHGFRLRSPRQDVYTLAANAALRLILQYELDPSRLGFLGLGTESSTDNAVGAIVIKGMLNARLAELGLPLLPRDLQVPEFKHACLGGIYALKDALRYVAFDGRGRQALVISADCAVYARGSSGEATQGAGAVAMLVEQDPQLLEVDLLHAGSSSDYRGVDFRKPMRCGDVFSEFPVFNGKYSTQCYIDAVGQALNTMLAKLALQPQAYFDTISAAFLHRPYKKLPYTALPGCAAKLALGQGVMMELGNLYTAALPAWLAAGLEEACESDIALGALLAIGYGSGDAAEALPLHVAANWRARVPRMTQVLAGAIDLTQAQYMALHAGDAHAVPVPHGFVTERFGNSNGPDLYDRGVAYYAYHAS